MSRNISANSVVNAARRQGTRRAGRLSIVPRQRDTLIAIHHGLLLFLVHSAGDFVTRQPGHRIIDLSLRLLATLATVYGFRIDRFHFCGDISKKLNAWEVTWLFDENNGFTSNRGSNQLIALISIGYYC